MLWVAKDDREGDNSANANESTLSFPVTWFNSMVL